MNARNEMLIELLEQSTNPYAKYTDNISAADVISDILEYGSIKNVEELYGSKGLSRFLRGLFPEKNPKWLWGAYFASISSYDHQGDIYYKKPIQLELPLYYYKEHYLVGSE